MKLHTPLPSNSITQGILDPFAFPEVLQRQMDSQTMIRAPPKEVGKYIQSCRRVLKIADAYRRFLPCVKIATPYKFLPLDQSAAYILGLFQKKNSVLGPFGGNAEDFRGPKKNKNCTKFWCASGGAILL